MSVNRGPVGGGERRSPPYRFIESARFVGAAWWTVVGDQHRDPRQRDRHGNDCQGEKTVVPHAVRDGGEQQRRNAERHDRQIFPHALTVLDFVRGCGGGDEDRSTIVVETQLLAAPHFSTVAQLCSRWRVRFRHNDVPWRPRRSSAPTPTNASTTGPTVTPPSTSTTSRRTRSRRAP